ncbi:MAG: DUF1850 domain-containing protein [Spirochaetae bacterium HGW-Spirochaetae-3]|jgi:hypothetical protein|nr:MAG: DUF1850 domain-containing protein [Spirochaetae bacterium HGW-Spirochaetae-3]
MRGRGRIVAVAVAVAAMTVAALATASLRSLAGGLELVVSVQSDGRRLLSVPAAAGDRLEFEWIHSVEHFPWFEYFDVAPGGAIVLRETRIGGFGAGVPYERGTSARVEDGFVVYSGIDETFPSYRWINSQTAVAAISLNGNVLARGSDLPHHEALELRIQQRR